MRAVRASTTSAGSLPSATCARSTMAAYSSGVTAPTQGAGHRPRSARTQAEALGRLDRDWEHVRSGSASARASAAASAVRRLVNGPM